MAVQLKLAKNRVRQEVEEALQREEEHNREKSNQSKLRQHLEIEAKATKNDETKEIINKSNQEAMIKPKSSMGSFLKIYSKNTTKINQNNSTFQEPDFTPAKIYVEPGKSPRNGYVFTKDKMAQDIQDCYQREEELKKL